MNNSKTDKGSEWSHSLFIGLRLLVVVFAAQAFGQHLEKQEWVFLMIIISVGVLMPLAEPLTFFRGSSQIFESNMFSVTVFVMLSMYRTPGRDAVFCAVVWLGIAMIFAARSGLEWRRRPQRDLGNLCVSVAGIFPAIGAAWLVAHRANWTPWGFDPLIVLLTAAHFHHAGFTLPLMAGLNAKARPGCWTRFSCVAILLGVPFVAAGITCTHFGVLPFVEPFGVTILVIGALGVAVSQIRRGLERDRSGLTRAAFVISGVSLLAAMLLAMSFGLRYLFPQLALTMPQMWMIHGTLNAFGFGLCGILAWRGAGRVPHSTKPCCA